MKYLEVYEAILLDIKKRKLSRGDKLPSVRNLVDLHQVNKSTVLKAYEKLQADHKVYAVPQSGYYLLDCPGDKISDQRIDLQRVRIHDKLLPYNEFNHAINQAIKKYQSLLFDYSEPRGLLSLRRVMVEHLKERHIYTDINQLMIVSGAQQALALLKGIIGDDHIVVETPGYKLFYDLFDPCQLRPYDRLKGFDYKTLKAIFSEERVKYFYTMPTLHNPTGLSYSSSERQKILDLARRYDVMIIEDDFISDLSFKTLAISHYDTDDRVFYIKSFSKTFMPGNRIGVVKVPKQYMDVYVKEKHLLDLNTSVIVQGALEVYLTSGMYERHVVKAKKYYHKKMKRLQQLLDSLDSYGIDISRPDTGLFILIRFSKVVSFSTLEKKLLAQGIYIKSADDMFLDTCHQHAIRLCTAYYDEDLLGDALIKIVHAIRSLLNDE